MLPKIFHFLFIALEVLLIFNVIIVVHELGHFLAARWRGLVVEEFGVWFGRPLWKKKIGGIWYSLGSIPAGGFVKLPQMAAMETIEGSTENAREALPTASALDKVIVAFAGPLFSFMLALAMGCIVWAIGKPSHEGESTTVIGYVVPGGPAERAGLLAGDEILKVDGKEVSRFSGPINSVMWNIMRSEGEKIHFLVKRGGQEMEIASEFSRQETAGWQRKALRKVQIAPLVTPYVSGFFEGGAGERAGLQVSDVIREANGKPVASIYDLETLVQGAPAAPLELKVDRAGALVPVLLAKASLVHEIQWGRVVDVHPKPWTQVKDAVHAIGNMIGALFAPKSEVKAQHFSGPVGIMKVYYQLFDAPEGWKLALAFSVFFNVNLALINMLPFPVLDGGHITLAIIEGIRRRPINPRFLEWVQTACALAIIGFMVYVTFFDVGELLPRWLAPTPEGVAK